MKRNTGLKHSQITPYADKFLLQYTYHGSSEIFTKEFTSLEEAQKNMEELRSLGAKKSKP